MNSYELRSEFLNYFKNKNHEIVKSAPLIAYDDPDLLFVNSGMVQFKNIFTGNERCLHKNITSSQKCLRVGGKHNDLDNVGYTSRHHTFFEMLGNFSFGGYSKEKACIYAWEFLTGVLKLDTSKLTVTIFAGEDGIPFDSETEKIWRNVIGLSSDSVSFCGAKDNFWTMGDFGPCGPCTEIYYEIENSDNNHLKRENKNIELWNLVFIEYEAKKTGKLNKLPFVYIDTGIGLERLTAVVNNLSSNYDTDLLFPYIDSVSKKINKKYTSSMVWEDVSMRVIADHCRATAFLIADDVFPGNEGRNYILRKIIRRSIHHVHRLNIEDGFFGRICESVADKMGKIYPELLKAKKNIGAIVDKEESLFRETLDKGLSLFKKAIIGLSFGDKLDGGVVFKLHETYGFPVDLAKILASENDLIVDWGSFNCAKEQHRIISSKKNKGVEIHDIYRNLYEKFGNTVFTGYRDHGSESKVLAIIKNETSVETAAIGDQIHVVLDKTTFYGESGGQSGDCGNLTIGKSVEKIIDTSKIFGIHVHLLKLETLNLSVGDSVYCEINRENRSLLSSGHSATHLLNGALKKVLGSHVAQRGSLISSSKLRFDFSHFQPLTKTELVKIELMVNEWIIKNSDIEASNIKIDDAKKIGATMLLDEKYKEEVRVIKIGPHSLELCGGTHVSRSGDIGFFKITSESALASGIRRIEAITGLNAVKFQQKIENSFFLICRELNVTQDKIVNKVNDLLNESKENKKTLYLLRESVVENEAIKKVKNAKSIGNIKLFIDVFETFNDVKMSRLYAEKLITLIGSGIVCIGSRIGNKKCVIFVAISKNLEGTYDANSIAKILSGIIGGNGGGSSNFAQIGSENVEKLKETVEYVRDLV